MINVGPFKMKIYKVLFVFFVFILAIHLHINNVSASGWVRHTIDNNGAGADGVRLMDVNGDGLLDVMTGWEEDGQSKLYIYPGVNKVTQPWPVEIISKAVAGVEDFTAIRINGSIYFISATERNNNKLYIHTPVKDNITYTSNAIQSSFELPSWMLLACKNVFIFRILSYFHIQESCRLGAMPQRYMYILPLVWDGPPAFIAGSKEHNAQLTLFEYEGGRLDEWKATPLVRIGWTMSIMQVSDGANGETRVIYTDRRGSDLDGNGKFDDSINPETESNAPKRGVFLLTHGQNGWQSKPLWLTGDQVMFLNVINTNNDGIEDIIVATKKGYLSILESVTHDQFTSFHITLPDHINKDLKGIATNDFDGDGYDDLVLSVESANVDDLRLFIVYLGKAKTITGIEDVGGDAGQKFDQIKLVDLNQDGNLDILTTEEIDNLGVIWYENPKSRSRNGNLQ